MRKFSFYTHKNKPNSKLISEEIEGNTLDENVHFIHNNNIQTTQLAVLTFQIYRKTVTYAKPEVRKLKTDTT